MPGEPSDLPLPAPSAEMIEEPVVVVMGVRTGVCGEV